YLIAASSDTIGKYRLLSEYRKTSLASQECY
ncbi:MAG: hypothetical protein ACI9DJ_000442, partial [Algoriphagus sp.]